MRKILIPFCLLLSTCQTQGLKISEERIAVGCYSARFQLVNETGVWTDEDTSQLANNRVQCYMRYQTCILTFTKVTHKGYTVLCGK